ncbi:MAG: carboxymuconolactone decarboxylase family protein [Acidobacteriia bacterium]|nr:carboxymuconolactone decarboxylase family protein [Terriglobia bacterium]
MPQKNKPPRGKNKFIPASLSMLEPKLRDIYYEFYKEAYRPSSLDFKTKELISIAASLLARCEGCLDGHVKKALQSGATKHEISDAIAIAIGINAAAVIDQTDRLAVRLELNHFEGLQHGGGPAAEHKS